MRHVDRFAWPPIAMSINRAGHASAAFCITIIQMYAIAFSVT